MTKKNLSNRSTRGFTLLEVLIAVLIVGIIATAAVPLVSDYAERARDAQIEANTKAVEMASQRYELVHKVPLGYAVDTSTDTLYDIFGDDGSGFWMQLVNPTDVNGNILGASLDPTANAFVYGPYLAPGSAKPASLLLSGAATAPDVPQKLATGPASITTRESIHVFSLDLIATFTQGTNGKWSTGARIQERGTSATTDYLSVLRPPVNESVPTNAWDHFSKVEPILGRRPLYYPCNRVLCKITTQEGKSRIGIVGLGGTSAVLPVAAMKKVRRYEKEASQAVYVPADDLTDPAPATARFERFLKAEIGAIRWIIDISDRPPFEYLPAQVQVITHSHFDHISLAEVIEKGKRQF